jgi:hypothetical protein
MARKKTKASDTSDTDESVEVSGIPVRATRMGIYANMRRKAGDEFTITSEEWLGSWMERLDGGPNKGESAEDTEGAE